MAARKQMKKYIVYMHINKKDGKKYIGITCQTPSNRWRGGNGYNRCPFFYNSILKNGWDNFLHEILFDNLSEKDAKSKEKELILLHNTRDKNYGYNLTEGGDGSSGYKYTEAQIECMKKDRKNRTYENVRNRRMVEKYDLLGNYICVYNSVSDASRDTFVNNSDIAKCAKGKLRRAGDFNWKYCDFNKIIKETPKQKPRRGFKYEN